MVEAKVCISSPTTDGDTSSSKDLPLDFLGPSENPEHVGTLGPYEIIEVIGRGGMGVVLKGHDPRLNRFVAIKVLTPELASNANARKYLNPPPDSRSALAIALRAEKDIPSTKTFHANNTRRAPTQVTPAVGCGLPIH